MLTPTASPKTCGTGSRSTTTSHRSLRPCMSSPNTSPSTRSAMRWASFSSQSLWAQTRSCTSSTLEVGEDETTMAMGVEVMSTSRKLYFWGCFSSPFGNIMSNFHDLRVFDPRCRLDKPKHERLRKLKINSCNQLYIVAALMPQRALTCSTDCPSTHAPTMR